MCIHHTPRNTCAGLCEFGGYLQKQHNLSLATLFRLKIKCPLLFTQYAAFKNRETNSFLNHKLKRKSGQPLPLKQISLLNWHILSNNQSTEYSSVGSNR